MEDLQELRDDGYEVEEGTSPDGGESRSTVEAPQSARQPKVNLDDLEEFRKFKSQTQRQYETERQERLRLQRELEEQRKWRIQVERAGMSEVELAKAERDDALRLVQAIKEEENRRYQEWQWGELVKEVMRETGAPEEMLQDAKDSNDLWRIGRKYESGKRRRSDDDEDDSRAVDDRVALGSNKATSLEARLRNEMKAAKDAGNMSAIFAVQEKAHKAGITLRR